MSILSAALLQQPTGSTQTFAADIVVTPKHSLKSGYSLDGEGGYTVLGKLNPAAKPLEIGGLPIGLAHSAGLISGVAEGACTTTGCGDR